MDCLDGTHVFYYDWDQKLMARQTMFHREEPTTITL